MSCTNHKPHYAREVCKLANNLDDFKNSDLESKVELLYSTISCYIRIIFAKSCVKQRIIFDNWVFTVFPPKYYNFFTSG